VFGGIYINNWIELTPSEEEKVWKRVYIEFQFKPSTSEFPSFFVPNPFITYDISTYLNGSLDDVEWDFNYADLEEKALLAFQNVTSNDEYFYALDWHHPCYWVNPFLEFPRDEFNEWTIPIFPNGDYYFFIQKDFNWGFLGHPWEKTITIFGKELIKAFQKERPRMFNTILRTG
jgi:hypothetical protein